MRQVSAWPAPAACSAAGARSAGSGLARYRAALRTPGALASAVPGEVGRMPAMQAQD